MSVFITQHGHYYAFKIGRVINVDRDDNICIFISGESDWNLLRIMKDSFAETNSKTLDVLAVSPKTSSIGSKHEKK